MSARDDGGPAFRVESIPPPRMCSSCEDFALRRQGNQWLCARHYRIGQMRQTARRHGKYVPTRAELETLWSSDNKCPDCGQFMAAGGKHNPRLAASLQHYRDGSLAIVCRSCNTRHAAMPGDTYRDMPKDHKWCPHCEQAKPFAAYDADNSRSGVMKLKSWCKECALKAHTEWQRNNRDQYNKTQREGRSRRAAG